MDSNQFPLSECLRPSCKGKGPLFTQEGCSEPLVHPLPTVLAHSLFSLTLQAVINGYHFSHFIEKRVDDQENEKTQRKSPL